MSGQKRLIMNDLASKGKLDSVNEALAGNLQEKAIGIKEIECKESSYEAKENEKEPE